MIVSRYVLREVAVNFLGVVLLLTVMVLSSTLIRLLNDIIEGSFPADILLTLFALRGVGNLVFIMPLGFFLAVMLAFGRLYRDSEMVVLSACGVRPGQLLKVVGGLGAVVALVVAALSLVVAPWVERYSEALTGEASARTEVEGITPGQFNQSGDAGPVIYAESMNEERGRLQGVFAQYVGEDGYYQITASEAYEQVDEASGVRYLILVDGYRYEGTPGRRDYRIIRFEEHGLRIEDRQYDASDPSRDGYTTGQLLGSGEPADIAELQWRLSIPVGTLLLGLLAVPLSKTSPRRGRFGGMALGFMTYLIYNNLLVVAKSSMVKGDIPAYIGMWWVQLLLLGVLWFLATRGRRLPAARSR